MRNFREQTVARPRSALAAFPRVANGAEAHSAVLSKSFVNRSDLQHTWYKSQFMQKDMVIITGTMKYYLVVP